jgi:ribonuclease HII
MIVNIKDSKKLSPTRRAKAYEFLMKYLDYHAVGIATETEIDEKGILNATALAMKRCMLVIESKIKKGEKKELKIRYVIDGKGWEMLFKKDASVTSVVRGDQTYYSVAAASIIAKEVHDGLIRDKVKEQPELDERYGLLSNKGYGTKKHLVGLIKYGPSDYHRKSFRRCKPLN